MSLSKGIKVLIVDDSRMHRKALSSYLGKVSGVEVVGLGSDGLEGVDLAAKLSPDIVLMDVQMPILDGLQATQRIMARCPTPILLMTAADNLKSDVDMGMRALAYGALDLISKPDFEVLRQGEGSELVGRLKLLAGVPVIYHRLGREHLGLPELEEPGRVKRPSTGYFRRAKKVVGVVTSTGGPNALKVVLSGLPDKLKAALVVVQHIDAAFEDGLVRWLDEACPLPVCMARDKQDLMEGMVYVAPQNRYAELTDRRRLELVKGPVAAGAHCPSGDRLLASAARSYGRLATGVVMTGMGTDGAEGLLALRRAGGMTIAQDEATSVIYGMPQAAANNGAAIQVLPLDQIAAAIAMVG